MRARRAVPALGALVGLALALPASAAVPTRSLPAAVRAAKPAGAPFRGLTATTIHAGGRTLKVALATTDRQRQQGLRRRATLGPYDGMLFVFQQDIQVSFTMSTVPVPLDIGFYRRDGAEIGHLHMLPCAGPEAACPTYSVGRAFRYALETLTAQLPAGRLSG